MEISRHWRMKEIRLNPEVMGEAVQLMNQYPGLGLAQAAYLQMHPEFIPTFTSRLSAPAETEVVNAMVNDLAKSGD